MTCKGEGAPKERPASLARAMLVLAQGPRAGEGLAGRPGGPAATVPVGPPAGARHENLPVASAASLRHTLIAVSFCSLTAR